MAVTRHCKTKSSAKKMARRLRKKGNQVSVSKRSKGYSVTSWKK